MRLTVLQLDRARVRNTAWHGSWVVVATATATHRATTYLADLPEVVVVAAAVTRDLLLSKRVVDLVRVQRMVCLDVNETEGRAHLELSGTLHAPVVIVVTLATVAIPETTFMSGI